jgi:hypothetical protein
VQIKGFRGVGLKASAKTCAFFKMGLKEIQILFFDFLS